MSRLRPCLLALLLALLPILLPGSALAAPQPEARSEEAVILGRLPHDPSAFTQGLALLRGQFYESTGLYGLSEFRRVDPSSGRVLASKALDGKLFGEGLAYCPPGNGYPGGRFLQLTWLEGRILTYDPDTLQSLGVHPLRTQGWGLACGAEGLVQSDGSDRLHWLNPKTLAATGKTLRVRDGLRPVVRLNELEWVNGWILANVWQEDRIAVIRPDDGQVALWLDLAVLRRELKPPAEASNGIAFDPRGEGGRGALYLTGKRWPVVFLVRLPELLRKPPARELPRGRARR